MGCILGFQVQLIGFKILNHGQLSWFKLAKRVFLNPNLVHNIGCKNPLHRHIRLKIDPYLRDILVPCSCYSQLQEYVLWQLNRVLSRGITATIMDHISCFKLDI